MEISDANETWCTGSRSRCTDQGRTCLDILWGGRRREEGGPLTPTTRVKPLCLWASEPHPLSFGVHSLGTSSFPCNGTFCKSVLLTLLISILREARSPAPVTVCSRSLSSKRWSLDSQQGHLGSRVWLFSMVLSSQKAMGWQRWER